MERLQKLIAQAGIASRRAAEQLIVDGEVSVNGSVVTELGTKADPDTDHIKVRGKLINTLLKRPRKRLSFAEQTEGISFKCRRPRGKEACH
jgi:23S rRNA pseudouridine2605 synthase